MSTQNQQGSEGAPEQEQAERPVPTQPEKSLALWCHLSALAGFVLPIPLASILGPLIIWLVKKDQMPFVNDQGKEALNFQITMVIAGIVSGLLMFVIIGFILLPAVVIVDIIFVIIAAISASKGEYYRYPISIRLIR